MGRKIKVLHLDNGGEYTSDPFPQLCRDEGIERHFTVRETFQENGVAERMNKTLLEKICCVLSNTGILKSFWVETLAYVAISIMGYRHLCQEVKLLWKLDKEKLLMIMIR